MSDQQFRDKVDALLVELQTKEAQSIGASHAYTETGDQLSAEKIAYYVDGVRFAVRKLEALLRDEIQT